MRGAEKAARPGRKKAEEKAEPKGKGAGKVVEFKKPDDWLFKPLSEVEAALLKYAVSEAFDLLDGLLWHVGVDTDPKLGGMPIWHLEPDEAETLVKTLLRLAERDVAWNARFRMVIMAADYYAAGRIVGVRLAETVFALIGQAEHGIRFRLSKREAYEEWEKLKAEAEVGS